MTKGYWQAKIWGLLHDPVLKALHSKGRGGNSFWRDLGVMKAWVDNNLNPEFSTKTIFQHIHLADYITSASDRGAIGSLTAYVNYKENGLEICHLLSGEKQQLKVKNEHDKITGEGKTKYLEDKETELLDQIPPELKANTDDIRQIKKLYWWLWRCLPKATCEKFNDYSLLLMPAETRLPDGSIWSHGSLTSAIAGALAGYDLTEEDIINRWKPKKELSHAYLASFTFSPVQELIKASRKMRDFWAGSWILHYLSAKVCWRLALQYGPDCFIYPNLYEQPLIDLWLLQEYPNFKTWIDKPSERQILTAGFPNVIVLVLPKDKVEAAMQTARSELLAAWGEIGDLVFTELHNRYWQRGLSQDSKTWEGWLKSQWQIYWTAVPIGVDNNENGQRIPLKSSEIYKQDSPPPVNEEGEENNEKQEDDDTWIGRQNTAYKLTGERKLFVKDEINFLREAAKLRYPFAANVGSWWPYIFDQTRLALNSVKNARTWEIPTAFGPRSTISGIGPVVHPEKQNNENHHQDWITEGETKEYWQRDGGLFDGIEKLNATETVKRVLQKILVELLTPKKDDKIPQLLFLSEDKIAASYPDLTAGVAGYLKNGNQEDLKHFQDTCQAVNQQILQNRQQLVNALTEYWGIPWIDDNQNPDYRNYHPRLLNAGWLAGDLFVENKKYKEYKKEDVSVLEETSIKVREKLYALITQPQYYPNNNPADWYILAAGDGDSMSDWLKGKQLKKYQDYIPSSLKPDGEIKATFDQFVKLPKRMGPSTHNALSRALLDFSNQLVPYLTERRYAGRLIYSGGDDVLAYTNLWEWDEWLWDIRECFRGQDDPKQEFVNQGDYWKWKGDTPPDNIRKRPLFTMGSEATISFGVIIAHHSVPLAIALEHLWEAEEKAKEHKYGENEKDAVQVRVLYGSGNTLISTAKFEVFNKWKQLLNFSEIELESSIFEQAANLYSQHSIPSQDAIASWLKAFLSRREKLKGVNINELETAFRGFFETIWATTETQDIDSTIQNWLKLAAFVIRNRKITWR